MSQKIYDFIVIGSGSSGGTLARTLHDSGAKILLLEAGKLYNKKTFPRNEMDFSSELFWGGGLEFDVKAQTAFLRAKCVGGTTIVNQALMDRFDEDCFSDWTARSGVDFFSEEAMAPYYERAEQRIGLHTFEGKSMNRNAKLFTEACNTLGHKWKYLRRAQSDCKHDEGNDCVACLGGCHRDSKQSSYVASIKEAIKNGLELVSEFEVEELVHSNDQVVVRGYKHGEKIEYTGAKVCVAGGSFGSTSLLLKSGYKKDLPALGKGFCQHPQFMYFGMFDDYVDSHKGAFQTVASGDPQFRKKGFKLEVVYAQPISICMLLGETGMSQQEIMRNYRKLSCIEVAVRDEPEGGEIKMDKKGNIQIVKNLTDQDLRRKNDGVETLMNILHAQKPRKVIESPMFFGLHLMGGCSIGVNKDTSVVNPDFQVHGKKNIYIADTSVYPSAPGINPSLTAMTLSIKLSDHLLGKD